MPLRRDKRWWESVLPRLEEGLNQLFNALLFGLIVNVTFTLVAIIVIVASAVKPGLDVAGAVLAATKLLALLGIPVSIVYAFLLDNALSSLAEPLDADLSQRATALGLTIGITAVIDAIAVIAASDLDGLLAATHLARILGAIESLVMLWAMWPLGSLDPGGDALRIGLLLLLVGQLAPPLGLLGTILVLYGVYRMREAAAAGTLRPSF